MMRQAYLSGPYSAATDALILINLQRVLRAALRLTKAGWLTVIPHCSMSHETDWPSALLKDKLLLRELNIKRDAIIMLPGWEDSRGSRQEKQWAEEMGLPVLLYEEALHVE